MKGSIAGQIGLVVGGLVVMMVGLTLGSVIISTAATTGVAASIGSFVGAKAMNDLFPLLFYVGLVLGSLGLMAIGGAGAVGYGPAKRR